VKLTETAKSRKKRRKTRKEGGGKGGRDGLELRFCVAAFGWGANLCRKKGNRGTLNQRYQRLSKEGGKRRKGRGGRTWGGGWFFEVPETGEGNEKVLEKSRKEMDYILLEASGPGKIEKGQGAKKRGGKNWGTSQKINFGAGQ